MQNHLVGTISASVLVSLALTGTSAWNIWQIKQGLEITIAKEFQLQELSGSIVHLDEVLTMSARMGASTGNTRWEDRYNEYVPKLDAAIGSLLDQVPVDEQSNPEQTDEANQKLVAFETQAFELVRQEKAPEALKLLLGPKYEAQKKIYNDGIQGTLQTVKDNVQTQLSSYQQRLNWSFTFALVSLAVSALTWYIVFLAVQGYIRDRKQSQVALESSQSDLQSLNQQLEVQLKQQSAQEQKIIAESELFQEDVGHILDVVSAIEYGDLTIEAQVNDRATGLISDTLNRLIESLHRIMSVVSTTASEIANNTEQLETLAVETNERAASQTQSVTDVRSLMENVNTLTTNSREQATTTKNALELAKSAVETGQQEMNAMVQGISTLEEGTEQIVKRTQLLNEFVDLAAQFSKDQKRVASLTRVLALNASMLSTRALKEKDPTQFASIAKEFETLSRQVNDLAAETNQTLAQLQQRTDQIQTVTSGLTQDVSDINQLVNKFTDEVGKSRQAFTNMQAATDQVALAGQQVRQANDDIFEAVQSTLIATQTIAREAEDTASQANITQEQAAAMGELAHNLANMVEFFQLRTMSEDNLSPLMADPELKSANIPLAVAAES
ncbi:methyl-accepting chemotaxis protein, putative [Acaryochloris marina MBIC11017]|uniref:Methyl-accepting chemotaxis protein, putative n=1 Tax=Acaryochloris marina (strain MBIC 11017) TaxID=329726 RepID=B0C1X6_ACAM1|nr:methyl-accepting chemotaxis protein, putative [Acaryochloris marina MBIC11017]